jgi:hypothetical protein
MLGEIRKAICDFIEPQPKITNDWFNQYCLNFTPDLAEIESTRTHHMVFICDTMMDGCKDRLFLTSATEHQAYAYTALQMVLWRERTDHVHRVIPILEPRPFARLGWCDPPKRATRKIISAPIRGQILKIPTEVLIELDKLKQNGIMFQRTKMLVSIPAVRSFAKKDGTMEEAPEKIYKVYTWMYVGNNDYWDNHIDGGFSFTPARIIQPRQTKTPPWTEKTPWRNGFYYYHDG